MRHLALALAGMVCSLSASAEIVTFEYTGIVNQVRELTNHDVDGSRRVVSSAVVPGTIAIGDTFHGSFSYDTALPLSSSGADYASYSGAWDAAGTAASLVIDKSGTAISANGQTRVSVHNGNSSDSLFFRPASQDSPYASFGFSFYDSTGKVFSDLSIPGKVNFNDFWSSDINIYWDNAASGKTAMVDAMVTSFVKVSPVPEPASYAMLFAGLAIIAGGTARKRNRIVPLKD
jgi:hypothetical protein